MKVSSVIISTLLLFLCFAEAAEKPFSISFVPESNHLGEPRISWGEDHRSDLNGFFIILTNRTNRPQKVFEYWNRWGYQAISFELTLPSGKQSRIRVQPRGFAKFFPSTFTIPPKGQYRTRIVLDEKWTSKPDFGKEGQTKAKIRVVYELFPTPESRKLGVWVGKIESEEFPVLIDHW